jgi:hypothetical protein
VNIETMRKAARNHVWVVEECVKGSWVPIAAEVSENIATKMKLSLQEFDLSTDDRYRVSKYATEITDGR